MRDEAERAVNDADAALVEAGRLLDAAVLARRFNVTGATVRNWITSGRVEGVKTPSGRWKITPHEYARLVKKESHEAQTPQI